jgi:hypothetical protein
MQACGREKATVTHVGKVKKKGQSLEEMAKQQQADMAPPAVLPKEGNGWAQEVLARAEEKERPHGQACGFVGGSEARQMNDVAFRAQRPTGNR